MGRQSHPAHVRTLHRNPPQEQPPALIEARTLWCPIDAQDGPADARVSGSARAIFHLTHFESLCRKKPKLRKPSPTVRSSRVWCPWPRRLRHTGHIQRGPHHRIRRPTRLLEGRSQRAKTIRTHLISALKAAQVINPEIGGNDARWINHCCDPNCEAIEEDGRIFIYAMRDIEAGEELFYDYAMEIDEPITEESKRKFACHCGSSTAAGQCLRSSAGQPLRKIAPHFILLTSSFLLHPPDSMKILLAGILGAVAMFIAIRISINK